MILHVLFQAAGVHDVTTPEHTHVLLGVMHIIHTYGTVLLEGSYYALMCIFALYAYASIACVTMERFISAAYTTYSTFVAVVDFFLLRLVVEEVADGAEIRSELYSASLAILLWFLYVFTFVASNFRNIVPPHLVALLRVPLVMVMHFIMAESA